MKHILDRVITSSTTRNNILTDGQFTCRYSELPDLLDQIDRFIAGRGVGAEACVAVECVNSLAGALLLVALLRERTSFLLTSASPQASDLKPTPHFCGYRLTVVPGTLSPAGSIRVEPNPQYNGKPWPPGKLYLRTSGSMGASKIVIHSHEKVIGNARNCVLKYAFNAATRALIPVPIAHMYGFGAELLPAIMAGASIDLQEKTNVLKYLDREKRFRPTMAFVTPSICEMLLKAFKAPRTNYAVFVTSGQRISEELFRAFDPCVNGRLINQYGSTEMGATSACDPGDHLDRRAQTIGAPMSGVQLRVAEGPSGAGELFCRHPYGFEGYVDETGEWLEPAPADGWYRTGDLATAGPDGSIAVLGRADSSVNRRGYLVLLSDIERTLEKLEGLAGVVVVAGGGENKQGQRIAAFCVPRSGSILDGTQLRHHCFDVLPHYAVPDEVRVTDRLPLLPSGKVDRQALAAQVTSRVP